MVLCELDNMHCQLLAVTHWNQVYVRAKTLDLILTYLSYVYH